MSLLSKLRGLFGKKEQQIMLSYEERAQATLQHLASPEVGDLFHEMYSFYVIVTALSPNGSVEVVEFTPGEHGTTLEAELKTRPRKVYPSVEAFTQQYCYANKPGAWVMYASNLAEVVKS